MADNSSREVHELLEAIGTDNILRCSSSVDICGNKALMSYSSLLPSFDLKNPFINPELDDVHSPFGGFLK